MTSKRFLQQGTIALAVAIAVTTIAPQLMADFEADCYRAENWKCPQCYCPDMVDVCDCITDDYGSKICTNLAQGRPTNNQVVQCELIQKLVLDPEGPLNFDFSVEVRCAPYGNCVGANCSSWGDCVWVPTGPAACPRMQDFGYAGPPCS